LGGDKSLIMGDGEKTEKEGYFEMDTTITAPIANG